MSKLQWGTTVEAQDYDIPMSAYADARWYELGADRTNAQAVLDRSYSIVNGERVQSGIIGVVFTGFYPMREDTEGAQLAAAADAQAKDAQVQAHLDQWAESTCNDMHEPGHHGDTRDECSCAAAGALESANSIMSAQLRSCSRTHLGVSHASWVADLEAGIGA